MPFDLVIHNGTIVTVNPEFEIIENGIICIKKDKITRVAAVADDRPPPQAKEIIDAGGGIIMPGLVNTHTHLPMTLFRGLADDLPLDTWLNETIFPAESTHINSESVRWGTLLACAEMIISGTTTCCDGYFLEGDVALAVNDFGMRAVLGQGVIDYPAPGVPDPAANVETAKAYVVEWKDISSKIMPSIFCHTPYTCSEETLTKAKSVSQELGALFQIHAAETKDERNRFLSEYQMTPIDYLDKLGILDQNTLLVHCIWLNKADIEIIAARQSKVSHNPESNMKLASGISPLSRLVNYGIPIGLGTDGCASNNNLDLFQEMDMAAKLHKASTLDPTVMDARTVLKMTTIDAARAIGLDDVIGSLEPGKQADIVIVDTNQPHLVPMYHPESHIVYAAKGSDVRDVMVAGNILVRDGKLLTVDLDAIIDRVNEIASNIRV
ncbi:MAG: amidohydrolase [Desulfobacterales bacterium]|nr:MAG: amidohydrolase [Desulfobacterales bacterium]